MDAAGGSAAPPARRSPNHPTGAAERQRQGGRLELKIEDLERRRHARRRQRAPRPAPRAQGGGAQAWPYTPRGRAASPAGVSGAARGLPGAAFHRVRWSRFPERSVILGPPPARVIAASARESGRLRRRPRTLARDEHQLRQTGHLSRLLREGEAGVCERSDWRARGSSVAKAWHEPRGRPHSSRLRQC
jgi:hypothetical protein